MGGTWNKKAGGHVFQTDPRAAVEGLLESGTLIVKRDGFFETPKVVTARMIELVRPRGWVLEPEAGRGAIAREIKAAGGFTNLALVERNEKRADELKAALAQPGKVEVWCADFLKCSLETLCMPFAFSTVLMNPPFEEGQDIDHVLHAVSLLAPHGELVSVMSEGVFFREDAKADSFRTWLKHVGAHTEPLPEGAFKESGTGVNTRLVVIRK